jgi:phenol 2-monooxygenase/3-hydroxybenzoate 4-monooxygenase
MPGKADGRWRCYAFAGAEAGARLAVQFLEQSPTRPCASTRAPGQDIDAVFDLRAIFQQAHRDLAIESMPALLLPRKGATACATTRRSSART